MTTAFARGLATVTHDGTVLDVWYPAPKLGESVSSTGTTRLEETPQQFVNLAGPDEDEDAPRAGTDPSDAPGTDGAGTPPQR